MRTPRIASHSGCYCSLYRFGGSFPCAPRSPAPGVRKSYETCFTKWKGDAQEMGPELGGALASACAAVSAGGVEA